MLNYLPGALILAGSISAISAQTPPYIGALLLQPALTTNKCLTAASNTDGAIVSIQDCTGDASQKWTFTGGTVTVFGNKCLDVTDGNINDGALLQVWTCSANNANQQFSFNKWVNILTWNKNGKCLDLQAGNTNAGNRPHMWQCYGGNANQIWNAGYFSTQLPNKSQDGQFGTNSCGTGSNQNANCQTAWLNSAEDFCLYGPPEPNSVIGDIEREAIAWCTKGGRGTRLMPNGTLQGVHFVKTPEYVQITGVGDFTKMNIRQGDDGGELDNRGADGKGNPIGGLIYGNSFGGGTQYHEWTEFISSGEFCIRACIGPNAQKYCNHIYDIMGCYWNMPANYDAGTYENCDGDNALPMGVYGTSTWSQGVSPTPPPHPAPASSNCASLPTITSDPLRRREHKEFARRLVEADFAAPTPAPTRVN